MHRQQGSTWRPSTSRATASCFRGQCQDLVREDKIQISQEIINACVHHTKSDIHCHLLCTEEQLLVFPMMKVNKHTGRDLCWKATAVLRSNTSTD